MKAAEPTKTDLQRLIHELEVQQEEVQIQNAQLIESQRLLEESRDRYANLYDFAPVAYLTLCEAGMIREINLTGAGLLGMVRGQLIDRPFLHFVEAQDRRKVITHLQRCRHETRATSLEVALRAGSGRSIPVQLSSNPAVLEAGQVRTRSAIIDLTDRKAAEAEQERLRASEAAARQALVRAEELSRVKDEFLAVASHELRTPISAVLLWVHLLKGCVDDAAARREAIAMIEQSANAESTLVNDLLDVSRTIVGKMQLTLQPGDLREVLSACIEAARPSSAAKKLALAFRPGSLPVLVAMDVERLRQVFANLLANAIKFTPENGHIDVTLTEVRGRARVKIADSGIGISAPTLEHVFDRFWQVDSTSTRKHGGLGLGLSIARQLVELHAGTIRAESPGLGLGATFVVDLPVAAQTPPKAPHATEAETTSRRIHPLEGLRILLVEDEPTTRLALGRLLRKSGAHVTDACCATDACAAFAADTPDLLISDISMPDEDGCTLLRRLREVEMKKNGKRKRKQKLPESFGVPAIAVTAHARPEDIQRTREAGFAAHLSKPVDPESLIAAILKLVPHP